ncbi:MAG: hypothetical protein KJ732_03155 [Candidatus Margulisbacteria bacterium]|nr:hypothetical protein [Candidatus Margulisiibacteriota bacterium]
MRRLLDSSRSPEHEGRYRRLVREVNQRHGVDRANILKLSDPADLKAFITKEIIELFARPDLISFEARKSLSPLSEVAVREARTIYIPQRKASTIYVSGQPPAGTIEVFEANPNQLGIDQIDLPKGQECVVAIPLVSSLAQKLTLPAYPRHGAIILGKSQPNGFDPQSDLRALRMIANDMAIVLAQTNQSL